MDDKEQRYYEPQFLHKLFAISSIIFLISLIAMFNDDFDREWRTHQEDFRKIDIALSNQQLDTEAERLEAEAEFKTLEEALELAGTQHREKMAAVVTLEQELEELTKSYDLAMQALNFDKAKFSAQKYKVELENAHHDSSDAGHGDGHAKEKSKAAQLLGQIEDGVTAQTLVVEDSDRAMRAKSAELKNSSYVVNQAKRNLSKLTGTRDILIRKLDGLDPARMSVANKVGDKVRDLPVIDFMNPRYNLREYQKIIPGITEDLTFTRVPRVDRCISCHQGIERPDMDGQANPHKAHPKLDLFVGASSPHPVSEFGCTSCHSGRGRGTAFSSSTHMPADAKQAKQWKKRHNWEALHHWDRPMYPAKYTEAGCFQCHNGQTIVKGADKLSLGLAVIEKAGCYACHEIDKFKGLPKPGPSLRHAKSKLDADWAFRWIKDPKNFREHTWMPSYFGQTNNQDIEPRTDQEIKAMVAFLMEESTEYEMPMAKSMPKGDAAKGKEMVLSLGCLGCHQAEDEALSELTTLASIRRQKGPTLSGLGSKTSAEWLFHWLKDPSTYHAGTRMPSMRLSDQEASDISAHLMASKADEFMAEEVPAVDTAVLDGLTLDFLKKSMLSKEAQDRLAEMSDTDKLHYSGERLVRHYGCFSCHEIAGFDGEGGIGAGLTEIGSKPLSKLDFGLLHGEVQHSNYGWFEAKLGNPRIFDRDKEVKPLDRLIMPNFNLSQEEIEAAVTVLLGLTKPDSELKKMVPRTPENLFLEEGERIVRKFNCRGCHEIDQVGGDLAGTMSTWLNNYKYGNPETPDTNAKGANPMSKTYGAPHLNGQGGKVKPEWFFKFLHNPEEIRPWMVARMPTFDMTDSEMNAIIAYFNYQDKQEYPFVNHPKLDSESDKIKAGKLLSGNTKLFCQTCHATGDVLPVVPGKDNWAPNFSKVKDRLKPEWVEAWLRNPQNMIPGTRMPMFWTEGAPAMHQDVLDGDLDKQIEAVRDYLYTIPDAAEAVKPAAETAAAQ